ncbi:hypothetical protein CWB99_17710 [Pseudoalteromonas rubra]|uniref:Uncharacterized protein n=1 Tax=Pseudoalteromonas rubra TaxID=43658 RepID=A0A5S3WIW1_9GAMM|nr:hypothetical protein [Pseudoalteromonas rubra]TMP26698.1 hypothetical protein CWB99_17710 [Pseudoalteromonas rubra]TMP30674.1 hypothetical protein CWC00_15940 [Pseudoalteromonas rubra]
MCFPTLHGNFIWMTIQSQDINGILNFLDEFVEIEQTQRSQPDFNQSKVYNATGIVAAKLDDHIYLGGWGLPYTHSSLRPSNFPYYVDYELADALKKQINLQGALANALSKRFGKTHFYGIRSSGNSFFWLQSANGQLVRSFVSEPQENDDLCESNNPEKAYFSSGHPTPIETALSQEYAIHGLSECPSTLKEIDGIELLKMIAADWDVHPDQIFKQCQDVHLLTLSVPAYDAYQQFVGTNALEKESNNKLKTLASSLWKSIKN